MAGIQDDIGWRHFLEGMIFSDLSKIQHEYYLADWLKMTGIGWVEGLIEKLLEVTHRQWLYRNIQVHDKVSGLKAVTHKEEIQLQIKTQQAIVFGGL